MLGRSDNPVFPPWVEACLPWLVFTVLVLFIAASAYSVHTAETFTWVQLPPFIALVVLGLAFGVWFIVCFTGDASNRAAGQDRRRRQSFRFCYVFTLSTLVVMIVPVTLPGRSASTASHSQAEWVLHEAEPIVSDELRAAHLICARRLFCACARETTRT